MSSNLFYSFRTYCLQLRLVDNLWFAAVNSPERVRDENARGLCAVHFTSQREEFEDHNRWCVAYRKAG